MTAKGLPEPASESGFISTGPLGPAEHVRASIALAHEQFRSNSEGANSTVYPALARMPADLFGICVVDTAGEVFCVGDADAQFTMMSISKPFVFALVCEALGHATVRRLVGVNATGLPFNSVAAIDRASDGLTNPMVNAGAIATVGLVPGATLEAKWAFLQDGLSRFAGRTLSIHEEVVSCALETNRTNQDIARRLHECGLLRIEPAEAVDLYTRQCSLIVTAKDVAIMGATLANGGVNPITKRRVVDASTCRYALAPMCTAGFYENSGDWLYDVGVPGKSGVSGGIVAVAPGKCGLGTFAPRLDANGTSVKGQLAAKYLSQRLGMNLLSSRPHA
jgi:glutaminase